MVGAPFYEVAAISYDAGTSRYTVTLAGNYAATTETIEGVFHIDFLPNGLSLKGDADAATTVRPLINRDNAKLDPLLPLAKAIGGSLRNIDAFPKIFFASHHVSGDLLGDPPHTGEYNLRFSVSADGHKWAPLTQPVLINGTKVADPSILPRENGRDRWWATFTGGDDEHSYHRASVAWSKDLENWTLLPVEQRPDTSSIAAVAGEGATWAGEFKVFSDGVIRIYLTISANTLGGLAGFGLYEVHALNDQLTAWSLPKPVFTPAGISVIDADPFEHEGVYYMWYTNKNAGSIIELASCATPDGTFVNVATPVSAILGPGVEAPSMPKITADHWRLYVDKFTNQGIFYINSYDAGATWDETPTLADSTEITGEAVIGFSHPTIITIDSIALMQTLLIASITRSTRVLRPTVLSTQNSLELRPVHGVGVTRRATMAFAEWLAGQDLYGTGDEKVFVIHSGGKDAVVFSTDGRSGGLVPGTGGSGFARFGSLVVTQNDHPFQVHLGGSFSDAHGQHPKVVVFDDGEGNIYGIGVSNTRFDFMVPAGCSHARYVGGQLRSFTSQDGHTATNYHATEQPVYADNAAAVAGGLPVGRQYHTASGEVRIVV